MKLICLISMLLMNSFCIGQEVPLPTQQQLENLASAAQDEQQKDDSYLQQLEYFKKHPLNINTATKEELQALLFLTDLQIDNMLHYRNLLGKFIDIHELQSIPTIDFITINKMLPYIIVSDAVSVKENFLSGFNEEQSLLFRETRIVERSKGYDRLLNNHYLGDGNHLMVRYRYQYKDLLYFGVIADKDAGEQFFKGAQAKGFDFYSVHFFVRKIGIIKALAIGDYTVNLGQGLIQWQSLGFGKSAEVMAIKRQSPALLPYRSAGEFNFNRGVGITVQKNNFEATVFASYKKISGNINVDTAEKFTSILTSGYYRTASEIADRYKITQTSFGGNISYQISSLKIGVNAVSNIFDIPLQKRNEPYNFYAFSGRNLFNSSLDYSYTFRNIHVFGEAATDKNFYSAFVSGILISVDPKVDLSILYRNLQKEYQSLFGNAFTENTLPTNEKGIYAGISIKPSSFWQINAYADIFQFPWLRYRVNAPSRGYDYLVQLYYQPNKNLELYLRYKNKNKPVDGTDNGVLNYPEDEIKQSLRMHFFSKINPALSFQSRMEMLWYDKKMKNAEQGFLGFVQVGYDGFKRLNSTIRLQYFKTNGYNSRIYVYESDVLYSFSIPAFYNQGFRYYINLNYDWKNFSFWTRWAQTIYKGVNKIGSGLDEIKGNTRSEFKFQLFYNIKKSKNI